MRHRSGEGHFKTPRSHKEKKRKKRKRCSPSQPISMSTSIPTPTPTTPVVAESPGVLRLNVARQRAQQYRSVLQQGDRVDMNALRRLAFDGIPDDVDHGLRALFWKLLLGYLPPDRSRWEQVLSEHRKEYSELKALMMSDPHESSHSAPSDHVRMFSIHSFSPASLCL